jgi:RNA polymerase sigma factor (sigma-70 family)
MGRASLQTRSTPGADAVRATERAEDARLVEALRSGDESAFGQLYDRWFDRLFDLCRHVVRDPEIARETAQDAFLAAWRGLPELRDPASFGGWLLRIGRNKALNRREREQRSQSVDDMSTVLAAAPTTGPAGFTAEDRATTASDPARAAEDVELVALVDDAAAALGARDATVLDLQLRYGLEPHELAGALGVSHNAAKQVVHRVRRRLGEAIKARVLWRGGSPRCDELRAALSEGGHVAFSADAARLINRHAGTCADCSERQESRLSPAALFSAVPVAAAPVLLKQKTALALEGADVPMGGSQAAAGAGSGSSAGLARRLVRVAVPAAVGVTIVGLVVVLAAANVGEVETDDEATPGSSTSTTAVTEPGAAAGESTPELAPETTAPPAASSTTAPTSGAFPAPGPVGPAFEPPPVLPPPPPPPPPSIVSFGISPSRMPPGYPMASAPVLSWSVNGGAGTVSVSGPGLSSGAFSGSQGVCPGSVRSGWCTPGIGDHVYALIVRDQGGAVVDQRTATLTTR